MKKVFTILAALLLTTTVMAQKGNIFVSGNFNMNSNSSSSTATFNNVSTTVDVPASSSFGLMLQGHYMLTDKLAIGLGIGYDHSKNYSNTQNNTDLFNSDNMFNIAPSVIYFIDINDKFKYAPEFTIGFGFGSMTNENWVNPNVVEETDDQSYFGLALMPLSFNYNINDNLALSFALGEISWGNYSYTDNFSAPNTTIDRSYNSFDISLNSSFRIGLRYFFN